MRLICEEGWGACTSNTNKLTAASIYLLFHLLFHEPPHSSFILPPLQHPKFQQNSIANHTMVVEKEGTFEVDGKTLYTKSWLVCYLDHMLPLVPANHH